MTDRVVDGAVLLAQREPQVLNLTLCCNYADRAIGLWVQLWQLCSSDSIPPIIRTTRADICRNNRNMSLGPGRRNNMAR